MSKVALTWDLNLRGGIYAIYFRRGLFLAMSMKHLNKIFYFNNKQQQKKTNLLLLL